MKKIVLLLLFVMNFTIAQNKSNFKVHSHNDYLQNIPFWKALSAGVNSVEVDVFLVDNQLMVAHSEAEIRMDRTIENLYLEPLRQTISLELLLGKPLQLLIDVKSDPYTTLDAIIKALEQYPTIVEHPNISVVISGNRPKGDEYVNYPDYILFDYQRLDEVANPSIFNKIGLISLNFKRFSEWNGKGRLTKEDKAVIFLTIAQAHRFEKPLRFWGTPDSKTAWKAFVNLGVDYINTDKPFECVQYLKTLNHREYQNNSFSEVYLPTFESDDKDEAPKNIILLIGDGNGLTQISATTIANKGELSLTQLQNIGLLKTQSSDDFTTDSAGAGTAIATGEKVPNRAIGMGDNGESLQNITEFLATKGFVSGIITTDEITGATPSSFYAHQKDRSMENEILGDLAKSKLSLVMAKRYNEILKEEEFNDFTLVANTEEVGTSDQDKVAYSILENNELSMVTKNGLQFLKAKKKPFFLMVEGAKIDSYGHANDIGGVITEGIGFDKAITEALKFADKHKNTLVIITADHETGGLTIPQGNVSNNEIEGDFTTNDHTGTLVPIFAYGPRSSSFQGVYENNEVFHKILEVLEFQTKK